MMSSLTTCHLRHLSRFQLFLIHRLNESTVIMPNKRATSCSGKNCSLTAVVKKKELPYIFVYFLKNYIIRRGQWGEPQTGSERADELMVGLDLKRLFRLLAPPPGLLAPPRASRPAPPLLHKPVDKLRTCQTDFIRHSKAKKTKTLQVLRVISAEDINTTSIRTATW